jgi:tripartite-type tricarboxylate transporter receptor subunit TctC
MHGITQTRRALRTLAGIAIATSIASCLTGATAWAQAYPSHPITMIVPFAAGGPTDSVARIVADRMQSALGQPVVIANVVGASGSIAGVRCAHAAPDGYTLCFGTWSTSVINGAVLTLSYDTLKDFEPVSLVSDNPMMIVANNNVPANNLKELIAWLRANPGKASSGTPGVATPPSLAGIFFQHLTGTRFELVHYRGGVVQYMPDLIAGRIQMSLDFIANAMPQVRAGNIKAFAVLAKHRLDAAPGIPTVDEAGLPGLYLSSWQAIWAPKGTPHDIVATVNKAVVEALADPAVRQRLQAIAQDIPAAASLTPEALGTLQKAEIDKWWPIVKAANIRAE